MAGRPASDAGTVNTSFKYMASGSACFSPRAKAALGAVGVSSRSQLRSEEHTSELQSLMRISYAVFCLKKKKLPHHIPSTILRHPIHHLTPDIPNKTLR